ncbi:MAG TPA: SDR family oxidoreductase [Candidatus Eisenbacteria bacterium]|nr:SDR family oxidoreductase [Candidatus Eisenbacteria bacterium]
MSRHFVTGATGFVGGALVLALLEATGDDVVCLVRADRVVAEERLHRVLSSRARAYGRDDLLSGVAERCRAVPGDLAAGAGLDPALAEGCREVWHAAASLRYLQRDADEIMTTNVEGTRGVLDLAVRVGAETFNHVSTAYVAGQTTGVAREEPVPADRPLNNLYERSKVLAEGLVLAETRLHTRVMRPSIVIGHSRTFATFSSTGLYGAFVQFEAFRERVRERLGAYLRHYRAQIAADPDAELNAIPVDLVAAAAVSISSSGSPARIFHLTNATPPTVADGAAAAFRLLGMSEPELVRSRATFSSLDQSLDRGIQFFASYMKSSATFDRAHADAACGKGALAYPLDRTRLQRFGEWFLDHRPAPALT